MMKDQIYSLLSDDILLSGIIAAGEYASGMLNFIPRGLPVYQSHGKIHSQNIIRNINELVRIPGFVINEKEAYILYLAAWLHDIGYLHPKTITCRSIHPKMSCQMIRSDNTISGFIHPDEMNCLMDIILFHDTTSDLKRIIDENPEIRTSLLAAIFRIADSIDVGVDRCPSEVFVLIEDSLDNQSKVHWYAHHNISGVAIKHPDVMIAVKDPNDFLFNDRIMRHVEKDFEGAAEIFERYGFEAYKLIHCKDTELD